MQKEIQRVAQDQYEKEPLGTTAWRSLSDTYRIVYTYVMSDLRQYGLTPPQYSVLRAIGKSKSKDLTMSEIGKEMFVTFANITTIVDNLEKRNYVLRLRVPSDRRLVKVRLTSTGSRLFKRINGVHRLQVARLMQVLNNNDLKNLLDYTTKIRASVNTKTRTK
jgi:DNA-binding MarR family transcriptional regulator